ncbi:hypothetical protein SK128_027905, partial [Halocaridina rubra]
CRSPGTLEAVPQSDILDDRALGNHKLSSHSTRIYGCALTTTTPPPSVNTTPFSVVMVKEQLILAESR